MLGLIMHRRKIDCLENEDIETYVNFMDKLTCETLYVIYFFALAVCFPFTLMIFIDGFLNKERIDIIIKLKYLSMMLAVLGFGNMFIFSVKILIKYVYSQKR